MLLTARYIGTHPLLLADEGHLSPDNQTIHQVVRCVSADLQDSTFGWGHLGLWARGRMALEAVEMVHCMHYSDWKL